MQHVLRQGKGAHVDFRVVVAGHDTAAGIALAQGVHRRLTPFTIGAARGKLLQWNGTGAWLSQRLLHQSHFYWPNADDTQLTLTQVQRQWLGVDW